MTLLSFTPSSRLPVPTFSTVRRQPFVSTTHHPQSCGLLGSKPIPLFGLRTHCPAPYDVSIRSKFLSFGLSASVEDLIRDAGATAAVIGGAYVLVFIFDNLTERKLLNQGLSRKLVHILSGVLFMLCWPIFSTSTEARYFAALVPLVNCLRLLVNGLSLASDDRLNKSVTREGNPEELLRGPLYYVLVLIFCALAFWRDSPIGIILLAIMCGGDGVADIFGRRFGAVKIPYNPQKSWAGSIAMFVFGFLFSTGMLYYYSALGYFQLDWTSTMQKVALVSLVATAVESLPTTKVVDDNISVPLASMAVALLSFSN
ncbi:Phytol kinase [Quillaja saponaria]|uniref:phytol kinase n=1 Tax=Quillaja saponaria TaxID=32244 RepID=A0AAD7Q522_QUISA|nr:Phytol kinase [Quillaja saponaria]